MVIDVAEMLTDRGKMHVNVVGYRQSRGSGIGCFGERQGLGLNGRGKQKKGGSLNTGQRTAHTLSPKVLHGA